MNHGTDHTPFRPASCVVAQTPGAYALRPPIRSTRLARFSKPLSAAKYGTCVVPACVMSGASPEIAAFVMRWNCTSHPTSRTSTLMPVERSNGARMRFMSPTGSGPLFMIHMVSVVPPPASARCA